MVRKILIGVLGAVIAGGLLTSCEKPETKKPAALSPSTEETKSLPGQTQLLSEKEAAQKAEERKRFAQILDVKTPVQTLQVGQEITLPVVVRNLGPEPWLAKRSAAGERPVKLWYHWIDWKPEPAKSEGQAPAVVRRRHQERLRLPRSTNRLRKEGKVVEFGGLRTALPATLNPRESVSVEAKIKAPTRPGDFILRLTMMREGEGSFENKGGAPLDLPVTVTQ